MHENHVGSGSAPREQMAVRANGFAAPAIKRSTSDARRLGKSAVLVQKCRKPTWISYLFYENLRVQNPAGQKKEKRSHFCVFKSERFAREWCTFYEKYKNWKSKMSTAPRRERNNKTTHSAAHAFTIIKLRFLLKMSTAPRRNGTMQVTPQQQ